MKIEQEKMNEGKINDNGCQYATEYLGKASSCLDCPFSECVFDKPEELGYWRERKRREEILKYYRQGISQKELASLFGVSLGTVYNVLRNHTVKD